MDELYGPFVRTGNPILHMDVASAELTKYAANAMLATRISFMNEIANLCARVGADVDAVRRGIGSDDRIGSRFLFAGAGYGGSCFPKDVKALINTAHKNDFDMRILRAVEDVNEDQKRLLFEMVVQHFGDDLGGKHFAMWGLAFKPNTDDMREAPSIVVAEPSWRPGHRDGLRPRGHRDGQGALPRRPHPVRAPAMDALEGADALIVVTEWNEFRRPDFEAVKERLRQPVIFDGRNIYRRKTLEKLGFQYRCIGS